jgi:methyl-accepting chemotaxis protein
MIMSYEGYQEALESQKQKEDELSTIKQQFNNMQSQLQTLMSAVGHISELGKKEIAKHLIEVGAYKQDTGAISSST